MCGLLFISSLFNYLFITLHLKSDIHLNNALIRIELKLKLEILECIVSLKKV